MTSKVTYTYTYSCDACGKELPDRPLPTSVGWEGKSYQADLCEPCKEPLQAQIKKFLKSASAVRNVGSSRKPSGRRKNLEASVIREWALQQGIELGERGRIPSWVTEKYHTENPKGRK